jgi:hypothetical protein
VSITKDGIILKFTPFYTKEFPWDTIDEAFVTRYNPFFDFGGWGWRYSFTKKAWAYTIHGSDALKIKLKTGIVIYLGINEKDKDSIQACLNSFN